MDIEQLEHFLCLADLKNFTNAAKQQSVSQPAFSRSIQRLEQELRQPLFDRKPRTVDLTDAGEVFRQYAMQIVSLAKQAQAEVCDDGETGQIRIGAIPTIAPFFLPQLLHQFLSDFPKATVSVSEAPTEQLLRQIKNAELDIGILALPIETQHLEVEELFDEELCLVLPNRHPLLEQATITAQDVQPYSFILLDEEHCLADNIEMFCQRNEFHPIMVERVNQLIMVQELVSLSQGISMIPKMAMRIDDADTRVYRTIEHPTPKRTIVAVWNSFRYESKLAKHFREKLHEYSSGWNLDQ